MAHENQWKLTSNVGNQLNTGPGSSENSVDVRGGSPLSTIPDISNHRDKICRDDMCLCKFPVLQFFGS